MTPGRAWTAARVAAVVTVTCATVTLGASPVSAAPAVRDAVIVDPATTQPLLFGGSHTNWSFLLPGPARCSGDSAKKAFFVYSYIAPASVDPSRITFNPDTGPNRRSGEVVYPLVDSFGSGFIAKNTAPSTGELMGFPGVRFNLAVFSADGRAGATLPVGAYNVGIACAHGATVDRLWNARMSFTASTADPNQEVWQANLGASVPGAAGGGAKRTVLLVGLGVAAVVTGGFALRRWSRVPARAT